MTQSQWAILRLADDLVSGGNQHVEEALDEWA